MSPSSNLAGKTFGYLTIVREVSRTRRGVLWLVLCRCGKELRLSSAELQRSHSKHNWPRSCGCYRKQVRSPHFKGVGDISSTRWKRTLKHAQRKGLAIEITIEYAWKLFLAQEKRCALTGLPLVLSPTSMAAGASTASLDRIDSQHGYTHNNVQWVHIIVQDMKSNFSQEEFVEWCQLVAEHSRRK